MVKLGIIAEDESDVAVLREITLSLLRPEKVGFKHFVGRGSGKIRRKCRVWADVLLRSGCKWIAVVHDLDEYDERGLRAQLAKSLKGIKAWAMVILIPKKEIETWLLYDSEAIASTFDLRIRPKLPPNPESLSDPKKYLRDLVWQNYRRDYINTLHNAAIAKGVRPARLASCGSFQPHPVFVSSVREGLHRQKRRAKGR